MEEYSQNFTYVKEKTLRHLGCQVEIVRQNRTFIQQEMFPERRPIADLHIISKSETETIMCVWEYCLIFHIYFL